MALEQLRKVVLNGVEDIRQSLSIEEDWDPMAFLMEGDSKQINIVAFGMMLESSDEKDLAVEAICEVIRRTHSTAMVILISTWTVTADAKNVKVEEGEEIIDQLVPPSLHPQRKEKLVMLCADLTSQEFWSAEINRPEGADNPELGEWESHTSFGMSGRFWDKPIQTIRGLS